MDVLEVHAAAFEAVARAKRGGGPTLVDCLTYRYRGHGAYHVGLDYRTQKEIDEWRSRDPIERLRRRLLTEKLAKDEELKAIHNRAELRVKGAVKFAQDSPYPTTDLLTRYLWA